MESGDKVIIFRTDECKPAAKEVQSAYPQKMEMAEQMFETFCKGSGTTEWAWVNPAAGSTVIS